VLQGEGGGLNSRSSKGEERRGEFQPIHRVRKEEG